MVFPSLLLQSETISDRFTVAPVPRPDLQKNLRTNLGKTGDEVRLRKILEIFLRFFFCKLGPVFNIVSKH